MAVVVEVAAVVAAVVDEVVRWAVDPFVDYALLAVSAALRTAASSDLDDVERFVPDELE